MHKLEKFLSKYILVVILLLSLPAVWALFVPGFYGASDDLHIGWLYEMHATLVAGKFPPRFVPDLSFGFGYPLFNFVFPLPFYIGELFHLLGLSFVDSIKAVFVLSVPLSMYFMYRFLKEYASTLLALAGAVIYVFTPYRSTDIYVRGAIGEILAFAWIPLIALSVTKLLKSKNWGVWSGILGLSTAALLTSHNIMAYMAIPFLVLLGLLLVFSSTTPRLPGLLKIFSGFFLGLLVSSYFWLPAIVESGLVRYDTVFNYADHFPTLRQLVTPFFGYGASVPGPYDGMSFFIGVINLLLVPFALFVLLFNRKKLQKSQLMLLAWSLLALLTAVFMMNYRSSIVWDSLPLIPYFQFPWRFLSLTTFVTPLFIVSFESSKYKSYAALVFLVLAIALNYTFFKPHDFLGRTDDYYINRYIPTPQASEEYLKTGEEYLRLPKATIEKPHKNFPRMDYETVEIVNSLDARLDFDFPEASVVNYYKYYFPGWRAKVDGKRVEVRPGVPYGQVTFNVPKGRHLVEVEFKETLFRKALNLLSLLSLAGAVTIILKFKRQR